MKIEKIEILSSLICINTLYYLILFVAFISKFHKLCAKHCSTVRLDKRPNNSKPNSNKNTHAHSLGAVETLQYENLTICLHFYYFLLLKLSQNKNNNNRATARTTITATRCRMQLVRHTNRQTNRQRDSEENSWIEQSRLDPSTPRQGP